MKQIHKKPNYAWQSRPGEGFDRRIGHAWLSSGWKSSKKNASCWRLILVYER